MKNIFSNNTQGLNIPYDKEKSLVFLPSNEDKSIVIKVTSILDQIIEGVKSWDISENKKKYYAKNVNNGYVEIGQHVVFYRVGDFNSQGAEDYERHIENVDNCSWVCLISGGWIFVQDRGNGTAQKVNFKPDKTTEIDLNSPILQMKTIEPLENFHNITPPYKQGRIYFAKQTTSFYMVWIPGFGEKVKSLEMNSGNSALMMDIDGQGNILDVRVEENHEFWHIDVPPWWRDIKFVENGQYTTRKVHRIKLNQAGEKLGYDVDHKEVECFFPDYDTKITTLLASELSYFDNEDMPIKWSWEWYTENNIMPSDVYTNWISRSPDIHADFLTKPGCGVYPPTGSFNDTDLFLYRIREVYADGSTRITQKDETETDVFLKGSISAGYYGCPFVSDPTFLYLTGGVLGGQIIGDDLQIFSYSNKYPIPPEMETYTIYFYQGPIGGGPPYTLISNQEGAWENVDGVYGTVKVSKKGWGALTGNRQQHVILTYIKDGCETWSPPIGLTGGLE